MAISVADTRTVTLDKESLTDAIKRYLLQQNQIPAVDCTITLLVDASGFTDGVSTTDVVSVSWST